jgi:hypothetical protein
MPTQFLPDKMSRTKPLQLIPVAATVNRSTNSMTATGVVYESRGFEGQHGTTLRVYSDFLQCYILQSRSIYGTVPLYDNAPDTQWCALNAV